MQSSPKIVKLSTHFIPYTPAYEPARRATRQWLPFPPNALQERAPTPITGGYVCRQDHNNDLSWHELHPCPNYKVLILRFQVHSSSKWQRFGTMSSRVGFQSHATYTPSPSTAVTTKKALYCSYEQRHCKPKLMDQAETRQQSTM